MNAMIDEGVYELMRVRKHLDHAHRAACRTMALIDTVRTDDSLPADERIAARSLLGETADLCATLRCAMNAIPEAAQPKSVRLSSDLCPPTSGLPCTRTAKSLLDGFKAKKERGPLAASVNYGTPICA